jgi:hypothetical protein
MRTIHLDDCKVIELWGGRRLFCSGSGDDDPSIINLPRGSMTTLNGSRNQQLMFGTVGKTTLIVSGSRSKGKVAALAQAIIESERPDARVVL